MSENCDSSAPDSFPKSKSLRKSRTIVDLSAWESCEVGGSEVALLSDHVQHVKATAVSSIRSSLFQKHALEQNVATAKLSHQDYSQEHIFETANEAEVLEAPFIFESSTSHEYCEYGKANKRIWTKDILALVHNAIRAELLDLISILQSLQKKGIELTVRDFIDMHEWWRICSDVILDFLDMENNCIIPWITSAVDGHESSRRYAHKLLQNIPVLQDGIHALVVSTSKSFEDLLEPANDSPTNISQAIPKSKRALLIIHSLDALISHVCNYMEEQELTFPQVLTAAYKVEKKERDGITRKVITYAVKQSRRPEILLALLTRWMTDPKAVKGFAKILSDIDDCSFEGLQAMYEITHARFVQRLQIKAGL